VRVVHKTVRPALVRHSVRAVSYPRLRDNPQGRWRPWDLPGIAIGGVASGEPCGARCTTNSFAQVTPFAAGAQTSLPDGASAAGAEMAIRRGPGDRLLFDCVPADPTGTATAPLVSRGRTWNLAMPAFATGPHPLELSSLSLLRGAHSRRLASANLIRSDEMLGRTLLSLHQPSPT